MEKRCSFKICILNISFIYTFFSCQCFLSEFIFQGGERRGSVGLNSTHWAPFAAHHTETVQVAHQTETVQVAHHTETVQVAHQTETVQVAHHTETVQVAHQTETVLVALHTETVQVAHHIQKQFR